jgi:hypothetical protein
VGIEGLIKIHCSVLQLADALFSAELSDIDQYRHIPIGSTVSSEAVDNEMRGALKIQCLH